MRSLSSSLAAALGAPVQKPALLVRVDFATVAYWSNYATIIWSGRTWTATPFDVQNLRVAALDVEGELIVSRAASAECSAIASQGMQDRPVTIYGYDAAATGTADVVWLASAVGGSVVVHEEMVRVSLRHPAAFLACPRRYVGPAAGIHTLLAPDVTITINGQAFTMSRR